MAAGEPAAEQHRTPRADDPGEPRVARPAQRPDHDEDRRHAEPRAPGRLPGRGQPAVLAQAGAPAEAAAARAEEWPGAGRCRVRDWSGSRYRSMAGRSASSSSSSPTVLAANVLSSRSLNSSGVSRPTAWCSRSSEAVRSRSSSDARMFGSLPPSRSSRAPCRASRGAAARAGRPAWRRGRAAARRPSRRQAAGPAVRRGQHPGPVRRDRHRVLEVRRPGCRPR